MMTSSGNSIEVLRNRTDSVNSISSNNNNNNTNTNKNNNLLIHTSHEVLRKRTDSTSSNNNINFPSKSNNQNSHNDLPMLEDKVEKVVVISPLLLQQQQKQNPPQGLAIIKDEDSRCSSSSAGSKTMKKMKMNDILCQNTNRGGTMMSRIRWFCSTRLCSSGSSGRKRLRLVLSLALIGWMYYYYCPHYVKEKPELWMKSFLSWVQYHPTLGMIAYVVVYALHIVLLLPATPLTLGGGYVFKATYGWYGGIVLGSLVSLLGSLLGSVSCFLLSRYCMRDQVRNLLRRSKHATLFDAVDTAITVQGFRIIALLYLTPVLPLGIFSYMVGTTSLDLFPFAAAKIFSLPLTSLYVVMGASTGTLVSSKSNFNKINASTADIVPDKRDNIHHVVLGMIMSIISLSIISIRMKKELQKVLDKTAAKKDKDDDNITNTTNSILEIPLGIDHAYSKSFDSSKCNGASVGLSPKKNKNNSLAGSQHCSNDHTMNIWRHRHRD